MMKRFLTSAAAFTLLLAVNSGLHAQDTNLPQVEISGAWARASVQGQKATGAFMQMTARNDMELVGVNSPAAGVSQVHEMRMQGDIMRMRPIESLPLPAGLAVALKPGSYHIMLMDLKAPLAKDSTVPLTLTFKNKQGVRSNLTLQVPVQASAPMTQMTHQQSTHH